MRSRSTAIILVALAMVARSSAAPLPPAVDKFHKEGIRLLSEKPAVIQGEVRTAGSWENHLLQLSKGESYQVEVSAGYPVNFRVVDAESGAVLFSGTGAKGTFVAPKKGQFRLMVGSEASATGKYSLTVVQKAAPVLLDPPGVRMVPATGLTIAGNIMAGDPMDKVRRHLCKTFDVRLAGGKAYQIDMTSPMFDTYLRVEDPAGRQIAFNDDGGDGLNSSLVLNVPADGVYRVVCTSFGGGQGAFTLIVRPK